MNRITLGSVRQTRQRQFLVVILLLMPLLSWVGSNGGVPICCWGMKHCPMAANSGSMPSGTASRMPGMRMPGMAGAGMPPSRLPGPAMPGCAHRPACHMTGTLHLILPAPAVPVYPAGMMARIPRPAPVAASAAEPAAAPLPAHALPIDHPPLA